MRKLLREKWRRIVFLILMSLCIIPDTDMQPILSPALALFAGIVVANTMGNPFEKLSREAVKTLLKIAIVGLGFGIHADKAMQAGGKGVLLTVFSIALTLTLGAFLGRKLTVDKKTSYLIASGTAICGGSAIAAVSPLVKADDSQISLWARYLSSMPPLCSSSRPSDRPWASRKWNSEPGPPSPSTTRVRWWGRQRLTGRRPKRRPQP